MHHANLKLMVGGDSMSVSPVSRYTADPDKWLRFCRHNRHKLDRLARLVPQWHMYHNRLVVNVIDPFLIDIIESLLQAT